jgi:hypothetical protein
MSTPPDDALIVRGGLNLPEQIETASGVIIDEAGNVRGLSVNCAPGKTVADLSRSLPYNRVGVTTVGAVRAVGGDVEPDPILIPPNPDHCLLSGISAQTASDLLTPTIPNPSRVK